MIRHLLTGSNTGVLLLRRGEHVQVPEEFGCSWKTTKIINADDAQAAACDRRALHRPDLSRLQKEKRSNKPIAVDFFRKRPEGIPLNSRIIEQRLVAALDLSPINA